MWITRLAIAACLLAVTVYAHRTQPTRPPTIPISLVSRSEPPTQSESPSPSVIGQEGCISRILSGVSIQSSNNTGYLVTMKRGRRRSFERRHPGVGSPIIQSGESGRTPLPVTVVNDAQTARMVSNKSLQWCR